MLYPAELRARDNKHFSTSGQAAQLMTGAGVTGLSRWSRTASKVNLFANRITIGVRIQVLGRPFDSGTGAGKQRMTTNIRDVAKAAGVSVATVSKALNGYPTVNQKTRDKVLRIVREMGFRPNTAARALVGQRSMTVGILLSTGLAHPFFINVMAGMEQELGSGGYDLLYLAQWSRHAKDYNFVRHCQSRNVEGVIVFGFQTEDLDISGLIESRIPAVFIDLAVSGPRAGYIASDHAAGVEQAVLYLRSLGHERIAMIADLPHSYVGRLRLEGYTNGLKTAGLRYEEHWVERGDYSRDQGREAMKRLLAGDGRLPTAVVCCSDHAAFGAMEAIRGAGLSVPEDISVTGFDDLDIAQFALPGLTTVRQNMAEIGRAAVERLDRMIREEGNDPPAIIVPTELIVRDSCARPRD